MNFSLRLFQLASKLVFNVPAKSSRCLACTAPALKGCRLGLWSVFLSIGREPSREPGSVVLPTPLELGPSILTIYQLLYLRSRRASV